MSWMYFHIFVFIVILLLLAGSCLSYLKVKGNILTKTGITLIIAGTALILAFIVNLWFSLERPPLRTLGETRLWYSFFLPVIGITTYYRWKYKWFLNYSIGLAIIFLLINYFNPDTYDKTLMPALQSPWFVPHVIVYIFSYALLAASSLVAAKELYLKYLKNSEISTMHLADNLAHIGFAFLTLGLLFGALWAKEAWGHYWTWDPKETWALLTWFVYLLYIHFRYKEPEKKTGSLWILALAFMILIICWFGINYLPTAQNSVHTYTN